jgi:hypothetical protein
MLHRIPALQSWFLARVTGTSGSGYTFQEVWLDSSGSVQTKRAGRFGSSSNPGYSATGTTFSTGQIVLARSADLAGGLAWELVAWSGSSPPPPPAASLTVQNATGSPSYTDTGTLQFVGADGLTLSQPTAGTVRVDLGLSGVFQPLNAQLTGISATAPSANQYLVSNGSGGYTPQAISTFWQGVVESANAGAAQAALGLGSAATYAASSFDAAGAAASAYSSAVSDVESLGYITSSALAPYLTSATAAATYAPLAGDSSLVTVGTITAGAWHGTAIGPAYGGTGLTAINAYAVVCGGTTTTGALQQVSGVGAAGQSLISNGPGALPTWQNTGAVPVAPSGLTAAAGNAQVVLNYTIGTGGTSANVYRSTTNNITTASVVGTGTSNSYTDTGVTNGNLYYYWVTSVAPGGQESSAAGSVSAEPSAYLLYDTFALNTGSLAGRAVEQGSALPQNWSVPSGTFSVSGGEVSVTSTSGDAHAYANAGSATGSNSTQVVIPSGTSNTFQAGVTGRVQDGSNYWLFLIDNKDAGSPWGRVFIYEKSGGSFTERAANNGYTFTPGSTYTLKISFSGTSIACSLNGTSVLSYSSSDFEPATGYGVRAYVDSSGTNTSPDWKAYTVTNP